MVVVSNAHYFSLFYMSGWTFKEIIWESHRFKSSLSRN